MHLVSAARQTYDAQKGGHKWILEILQGRDHITLQDVSGRYVVVAGHDEAGFLVRYGDQVISICKNGSCNWYAENARVEKGQPEITSTFEVKLRQIDAVTLRNAIEASALGYPIYLIGQFKKDR